jgi:hypothetical protein
MSLPQINELLKLKCLMFYLSHWFMETLAASKIYGTVNLHIKLIHIIADAGITFLAPLCPTMLKSTLDLKD